MSDDAGLIALADGTSGDLVWQQTNGTLGIDFTNGGAGGVNPDAHYELGDPNNPTAQTAFNITNLDAETHSLTVEYSGVNASAIGDGRNNIEFQIYDSAGTKVTTVSEEATSGTITDVASGSTLYVVLVVDTTDLTDSTDLSGTLKVSA